MFRRKSDSLARRNNSHEGSKSSLNTGSSGSIAESSICSKNSSLSSDPSISALNLYTSDPTSLRLLPKKKTRSSISLSILEKPDTLENVLNKKIQKLNKLDDNNKLAPLHYTVMNSNTNALQTLIRIGGEQLDFTLADGNNRTALMHACLANQLDLIEILVSKSNGNIDYADKFGYTCIHYAIAMGNAKAAQRLLQKSVNLNQLYNGDSYLHVSLRLNKPDVALVLIQSGVDVNLKDSMERSALHLACELELETVCEELLSHGADPKQPDMDGKYPSDYLSTNEFLKSLFKTANNSNSDLKNHKQGFSEIREINVDGAPPIQNHREDEDYNKTQNTDDFDLTDESIPEDISIEEDLPLPDDNAFDTSRKESIGEFMHSNLNRSKSGRRVSFSDDPIKIIPVVNISDELKGDILEDISDTASSDQGASDISDNESIIEQENKNSLFASNQVSSNKESDRPLMEVKSNDPKVCLPVPNPILSSAHSVTPPSPTIVSNSTILNEQENSLQVNSKVPPGSSDSVPETHTQIPTRNLQEQLPPPSLSKPFGTRLEPLRLSPLTSLPNQGKKSIFLAPLRGARPPQTMMKSEPTENMASTAIVANSDTITSVVHSLSSKDEPDNTMLGSMMMGTSHSIQLQTQALPSHDLPSTPLDSAISPEKWKEVSNSNIEETWEMVEEHEKDNSLMKKNTKQSSNDDLTIEKTSESKIHENSREALPAHSSPISIENDDSSTRTSSPSLSLSLVPSMNDRSPSPSIPESSTSESTEESNHLDPQKCAESIDMKPIMKKENNTSPILFSPSLPTDHALTMAKDTTPSHTFATEQQHVTSQQQKELEEAQLRIRDLEKEVSHLQSLEKQLQGQCVSTQARVDELECRCQQEKEKGDRQAAMVMEMTLKAEELERNAQASAAEVERMQTEWISRQEHTEIFKGQVAYTTQLQTDHDKLVEKHQALEKASEQLQTDHTSLKKVHDELNQHRQRLEQEVTRLNTLVQALQEKEQVFQAQTEVTERETKKVNDRIQELHDEVQEKEMTITKLTGENTRLNGMYTQLLSDYHSAEQKLKECYLEATQHRTDYANLESEKKLLLMEHAELQTRYQHLETECQSLQKEITRSKAIPPMVADKDELEHHKAQVFELQSQLEKNQAWESMYKEKNKECEAHRDVVEKQQQRQVQREEEMNRLRLQLEEKEQEKEKLQGKFEALQRELILSQQQCQSQQTQLREVSQVGQDINDAHTTLQKTAEMQQVKLEQREGEKKEYERKVQQLQNRVDGLEVKLKHERHLVAKQQMELEALQVQTQEQDALSVKETTEWYSREKEYVHQTQVLQSALEAKEEEVEYWKRKADDQHQVMKKLQQDVDMAQSCTMVQSHHQWQEMQARLHRSQLQITQLEGQVETLQLKIALKDDLVRDAKVQEMEWKEQQQQYRSQLKQIEQTLMNTQSQYLEQCRMTKEAEEKNVELKAKLAVLQESAQANYSSSNLLDTSANTNANVNHGLHPSSTAPQENYSTERVILDKLGHLESKIKNMMMNQSSSASSSSPPSFISSSPSAPPVPMSNSNGYYAPPSFYPSHNQLPSAKGLAETISKLKRQNMVLDAKLMGMKKGTSMHQTRW